MIFKKLFCYLFLFGFFIVLDSGTNAQDSTRFYVENHPRFIDSDNDTLVNAFAGGLYNPQFTNYDLNNNGRQDLVVFDRQDYQVLTFLKPEEDGAPYYRAPKYESQIPSDDLTMSLFFKDYNDDGLKDLFHVTSYGEVRLYKNVSDPNAEALQFEKITSSLQTLFPTADDTSQARIYTPRLDISAFNDIDNDGDMDIMAFSVSGGYVYYYRNLAVEENKPLDSLKFILDDRCWGCFNEFGDSLGQPTINVDCSDYPRIGKKKHSGATMLTYDADDDGDFDMVYGDAGFDGLTFLENGRVDNNYPIDTFINIEPGFPSNDKKVDIETFPGLFQVDIDGDGVKDLVASPQDRQQSENLNQVWYYKNTGSNKVPDYKFQQSDFLQNTMLDLGGFTHPAFYDYDQDGDQDLFVATGGNYGETQNNAFRLVYYENLNSDENPVYKKKDDDFLNLKEEGLTNLAPSFGDLNNNGRQDLVLGHEQGNIIFFANTGNSQGASFVEKSKMLDSIDVGWSAAPSIADVNGDGKKDLIIGTEFSKLYYYANQGMENGSPSFKKLTEDYGGFDEENLGHVNPTFADLNGNNKLDLLLGTEAEGLRLFNSIEKVDSVNNGDTTTHYLKNEMDSFVFIPDGGSPILKEKKIGGFLTPAVANLDRDTIPDIMLGGARGGLIYLGTRGKRDSVTTSQGSERAVSDADIRFYPNPTQGHLQVNYEVPEHHGRLSLKVYSLNGQMVKTRSLRSGHSNKTMAFSNFSNGVYTIVVANESGKLLKRKKIIISK